MKSFFLFNFSTLLSQFWILTSESLEIENNINLDDMLQSLLSHLRFYAIYNVLNSKVEIQTLAYFEGFAKLATIKQIKRKV